MRLAVVLDDFTPARGGAERYLAELAERLVARGHEVRVYCRRHAEPPRGVTCVVVAAGGLTRVARERRFAAAACARAREEGCAPLLGIRHAPAVDLYQPHGGSWDASAAARRACDPRPWRRAWRGFAQRWSPRHRHFRAVERALLQRPDVVTLAVSERVRDDLAAIVPAARERTVVVPPAIDVERFAALARARADRPRAARGATLLFVAHDFELKGLRHALAAFARSDAAARGARLEVAGRGDPAPYARLVAQLAIGAQVEFCGAPRDIAPLLAGADLLLHPTWFDPCALVCLEALAAGVPVVTTARNGAASAVAEAGGRVVALPSEHAELAAAIDALLAEGAAAEARAAAVGARFGWDESLRTLLPLLEAAAARRSAR
ncbi:MAG: glycosyltransferase family 4 protein [Planctomycetes bacterium]|nr:glycosyltransferase family 4 protein [Planctomycetota bacterium]